MRKLFLLLISIPSILFSQSNYWEHYSLNKCDQLVKNDSEVFYAVSFPNVLKSTDYGLSWDTIYTSENLSYLTDFSIFVDTNYIPTDRIIVKEDDFYNITLDGGNTWNSLTNMPSDYRGLTITSQGNIYFMGANILYSSSDNGETWTIVYDFPYPLWDGHIYGLVSDIYDNLYTTYGVIWEGSPGIWYGERSVKQSTNFGYNWLGIIAGDPLMEWVPDITLISTATSDIFAQQNVFGAFFHFDGSSTSRYFLDVTVNSALVNNLGHIYCSGSAFVYSTNQGNSWVTDTSGLSGLSTYTSRSVVIDTLGNLYVSSDSGIFKSKFTTYFFFDSLVQFPDTPTEDTTYQSATLRNSFSFDVLIDSITISTPEFFISENYNNIVSANDSINIMIGFTPEELLQYESEIILYSQLIRTRTMLTGRGTNPTNVNGQDIIKLDDFILKQNYPNPFNSQTIIEYIVPERSHIQIVVYDYLGSIVKILFDGIKKKGKYKLNFNADNLASGIYFYRMQASNFSATRKLILLK